MPTARIKNFYGKYEHYLSPLALIAGFVWDNLTLQRVDFWLDELILFFYLSIAAGSIILINAYGAGRLKKILTEDFLAVLLFLLQFVLGGLFSAFVVFYSKSAALTTSWPFIFSLAALLVGNELFRGRYLRFAFHLSVFFVAVFSFSALIVPVFAGRMGPDIFILSGLISLGVVGSVAFAVFHIAKEKFRESVWLVFSSIICIYAVFNILYFTNVIPPIPLAIKELGVYHSVERTNEGGYLLTYENSRNIFHRTKLKPVYVYGAVFAPTKITTKIFHRWSFFNEKTGQWIETSRIGFDITGGRDAGYRGYTFKSDVFAGKWRVDVITEREQIIGRISFEIIETSLPPKLETILR